MPYFQKLIARVLLVLLFSFDSAVIGAAGGTPTPLERDIVIYGATSSGIAAAVQAVRMGKSTVIVEPGGRIGGLTTGGLGQTDIGNKRAIGGISREFYQAIRKHYMAPAAWKWQRHSEFTVAKSRIDDEAWWIFEPGAALKIYEEWVKRDNIEIIRHERLDRKNGAIFASGKDGRRLLGFRTESGREFRGKVFIDATYEGDLMALAGVSYTVGREANALYGETFNGVQTLNAKSHNFRPGIDPYIKKGDPSSGLLPFIDPNGPGEEGAGDRRVQAYCFRMCLTDHPDNRIPIARPEGYREIWYELLFRDFEAGLDRVPWGNAPLPNCKTDINNKYGFSTDFVGQNYDYPEADYQTREEIARRHLLYQQGLVWTLANHPRVPENVRKEASRWGATKDEFLETGGWPGQLYIREARRMIGGLVMTQHHCQGRETVSDSIGMAAYTMDSHSTQRHIDKNGHVRNEGCVEIRGFPPYPVGYGALVPRQTECENLIVPVAMSASHIAYGSIRMEPVFMVFGQSAATAAAFAVDDGVAVQKVNYDKLRARLLRDGQVLSLESNLATDPGKDTSQEHRFQPDADSLVASVAALQARGFVQNGEYWTRKARSGETCDGAKVALLIMTVVSNRTKAVTLDEACDYLHKVHAISNPKTWKQNAVRGRTCRGDHVAKLIGALDRLTASGRP